jgi:hypothetical protein
VDVAHNEKLAELMARVAGELGEALLVFEEGCDGELTEEAFVVVLRERHRNCTSVSAQFTLKSTSMAVSCRAMLRPP